MASYTGQQVVLFPNQKNIERHPISISEHGVEGESYLVFEWIEGDPSIQAFFEVQDRRAYIGNIKLSQKEKFRTRFGNMLVEFVVNSVSIKTDDNKKPKRTVKDPAKAGDIDPEKVTRAVENVKNN